MKIVALIEDGHGHRHLLGSRSPDLVRRELSARAGTAMLLWCAVPPEYVGAGTIVTAALDRLNAHGPDALGALPADRILKVLTALCITEPRRANRWRRLERIGRGIGRWLHLNRRGLSMASHPHNLGT